ncbi:hypothetical protein GCM10025868_25190 [Angustibacter aerolatus]|uniref:ABC transporter domain-containing protein n=1 Tax=Angustibacter aerolatus TaxID=1162965 RepID=A0ABQ6JHG8_9ACTN|nr:hypothetical protein GCM10025868_25190 [Angustibacter aerolatus]
MLALRPGLLLLDEPTAMLDPAGGATLRHAVRDVLATTGATCVVVEHRVAEWLDLVDRVVVLEAAGGVVADGAPREVLAAEGARLAAQGVWVPGRPPSVPTRSRRGDDRGTLLQAVGVAAGRPGGAPVVRDVDLRLAQGRATALVGPNGAGKTTLAHVLAGLVPPAAGRLDVGDALSRGLTRPRTAGDRASLVARVGTVFQEPQHQFVAGTVAAELAVGPQRTGVPAPEVERRVAEPAGPAPPRPPGARQPVHAQRRRAAPALRRHRAGHPPRAAGARRTDVRAGRADLGRARGPARRACSTRAWACSP